jgi:hypothetical protein
MAEDTTTTPEGMDPELAALLGDPLPEDEIPDFDTLFSTDSAPDVPSAPDVDLSEKNFPEITKRFADAPHKAFDAPLYYKEIIANEGEGGQRLHELLQKYLNTKDPKDRGVFRQQLIPVFWEFLRSVARKAATNLPDSKKYLLRFAMLHPSFLEPENKAFFAKLIVENEYKQPIYYVDEWFKNVGSGTIRNSSTDEVKVSKGGGNTQQRQLLEKTRGKLDGIRGLVKTKSSERLTFERLLQDSVREIVQHEPSEKMPEVSVCYNSVQRSSFSELQETLKNLLRVDRELTALIKEMDQVEETIEDLKAKAEAEEVTVEVDVKAVDTEFETIRQMTKMTVGRQGNHFPILSKEYFHCGPNDVAFRENVISSLAWLESIDPEAFCRSYKNKLNRIVPYVVLLPNYGETGVCWEPFDRFNRATSRGRIAIPMYSKSLQVALLSAIGDLRWQVAKEKASYYWMEEGLTGYYYQWFIARKLKGDVKETFIQDYITWILKESEGNQKLDKDLRAVFWRYIPFAQPVKEKLRTRSFNYQELYQRDMNRSMSDGY